MSNGRTVKYLDKNWVVVEGGEYTHYQYDSWWMEDGVCGGRVRREEHDEFYTFKKQEQHSLGPDCWEDTLNHECNRYATRTWSDWLWDAWSQNEVFGSQFLGLVSIPFKLALSPVTLAIGALLNKQMTKVGHADPEKDHLHSVVDGKGNKQFFRIVKADLTKNIADKRLTIGIHGVAGDYKDFQTSSLEGDLWSMQRQSTWTIEAQKNAVRRIILLAIQKGYKTITLEGVSFGGALARAVYEDFVRDRKTAKLLKDNNININFISFNAFRRQSDGISNAIKNTTYAYLKAKGVGCASGLYQKRLNTSDNSISGEARGPRRTVRQLISKFCSQFFMLTPDALAPRLNERFFSTQPASYECSVVYQQQSGKIVEDATTSANGAQAHDFPSPYRQVVAVLNPARKEYDSKDGMTVVGIQDRVDQADRYVDMPYQESIERVPCRQHNLSNCANENLTKLIKQYENLDFDFLQNKIAEIKNMIWKGDVKATRFFSIGGVEIFNPEKKEDGWKCVPSHVAAQWNIILDLERLDKKKFPNNPIDSVERTNLWRNAYIAILNEGQKAAEKRFNIGRRKSTDAYYSLFRQGFEQKAEQGFHHEAVNGKHYENRFLNKRNG